MVNVRSYRMKPAWIIQNSMVPYTYLRQDTQAYPVGYGKAVFEAWKASTCASKAEVDPDTESDSDGQHHPRDFPLAGLSDVADWAGVSTALLHIGFRP
jgi:hypothetical protein